MPSRSRQERTSRSARQGEDPEHPSGCRSQTVADLAEVDLMGTELNAVDLTGAELNAVDLTDVHRMDAELNPAELKPAELNPVELSPIEQSDSADLLDLPVGFRVFGGALISDVVTEGFVRDRLDAALRTLLDSDVVPSSFVADITSARVDAVTCMSEDGRERCFAVTVGALLEADVGPRLLALGVDARIKVDLTVRVRAFRPGTIGFDIDDVNPNDVWLRARTRTGWLPFSLGDAGLTTLTRSAQRAVPKLCATVNAALADAVDKRRVDVLAHLEHYGDPRTPHPTARAPRAGREMDFGEFGEVLMSRGIDRRVVAAAVQAQLVEPVQVAMDEPVPVRGTIDVRVARVTASGKPAGGSDELWFRLVLLADADLTIGAGERSSPVTATVRAEARARLSARTGPATLVVEFEPKARLRVVRARKSVRGRMMMIPLPNQTLAPLRRRVTAELNRRLAESGTRLVAAEVVEQVLASAGRPRPVGPRD